MRAPEIKLINFALLRKASQPHISSTGSSTKSFLLIYLETKAVDIKRTARKLNFAGDIGWKNPHNRSLFQYWMRLRRWLERSKNKPNDSLSRTFRLKIKFLGVSCRFHLFFRSPKREKNAWKATRARSAWRVISWQQAKQVFCENNSISKTGATRQLFWRGKSLPFVSLRETKPTEQMEGKLTFFFFLLFSSFSMIPLKTWNTTWALSHHNFWLRSQATKRNRRAWRGRRGDGEGSKEFYCERNLKSFWSVMEEGLGEGRNMMQGLSVQSKHKKGFH